MADVASMIEPYFRQRAQNQNGRVQDGMNLELVRLGTFKTWPRWAPILPNRLARGGFFYTGQTDETECFSCHCKLSQWHDGDRPEDRHLRNSRNCDFMNGRTTPNIPLPRPLDQSDRGPNNRAPGSAQMAPRVAADSTHSLPTSPDVPRSVLRPEYEQESARLATFSSFPPTCYVTAEELAQAGFIYLGHSDRVQCAFCKGVLKNWVPGDRAWQEHQRHFPYCPFVQNPLSTHSLPPPRSTPAPAPATTTASLGNRSQQQNAQILSGPLHALGIATDRPKHGAFALEQMRLDTFKNWPSKVRQTPSQLAAAGFFYIGQEDSVKCFWCDGGLRNWEPADDPWVEHARWFPKCGHVKAKKGVGFIESCKQRNIEGGAGGGPRHAHRTVDPQEVDARLARADVPRIVEMGFERQFVRNIIEYVLQTQRISAGGESSSGGVFPSEQELLDKCLEFSHSPPSDFPLPPLPTETIPTPMETEPSAHPQPQPQAPIPAKSATLAGGGNNNMECKVCMDADVNVVFLPCGHLVCCSNCAPALKNCPICRGVIKGTVNAILS